MFGIQTPIKLFWACTIGVIILILIALSVYSCFVTRYRNYLKKQTIKEFDADVPG